MMALSSEQKKYIEKYRSKLSIRKISRNLNIDVGIVNKYLKSISNQQDKQKKRLFSIILLLIPVIFFVILELILNIANYGGNLDLFISGEGEYSAYKTCNQNVGFRYFSKQGSAPAPPLDLFLKEKPENCYRIFVLGGSTTAGYPYGNNLMFTRILQKRLANRFPERKIEMVNTAMAAINSYTFVDYMDEILSNEPDALLIYAGHNEFYGALGVASSESIGKYRSVILLYLKLKNFKIFLLLRKIINGITGGIRKIFGNESTGIPTATLMERLVADQNIAFGSSVYQRGKNQFRQNLNFVLEKAKKAGKPVLVSELVSNIRDQPPFVSLVTNDYPPALELYNEAVKQKDQGNHDIARQKYLLAKDLDALRFRASEEFNQIIHQLCKQYGMTVVPMKEAFESESENGLIGNNLMLEHLHPNIRGYFVMADAFFQTMYQNRMIAENWGQIRMKDKKYYQENWGYTELDSVYGDLRIQILKGGWPFKEKAAPNIALTNFQAKTRAETLAVKIWNSQSYNLERGHVDLAEYYENRQQYDKAFKEYLALTYLTPLNVSPFLRAADALIKSKNLAKALPLLYHSLKLEESAFAHKWIGQILLERNQVSDALPHLERALKLNPKDAQLLFNLGGAYALDSQYHHAQAVLERLMILSPRFPGGELLLSQVKQIIVMDKK
jgi:tetratricopeptide (TPR) repeat protein